MTGAVVKIRRVLTLNLTCVYHYFGARQTEAAILRHLTPAERERVKFRRHV